jgi:SAM-dependent methyltransferase
MGSRQATAYAPSAAAMEQMRLTAQALEFEPQSRWLLDTIGVRPGWHAADIGCGAIGILDLLSERIGAHGAVIGVEREPRLVAMARAEMALRGLRNVAVVQGDALASGLEPGTFDLVHERLVMAEIAEPQALVDEMASLLRPGGIIVLEDVDDLSYTCAPMHPSWTVLLDAAHTVLTAEGADLFAGRALPGYLRAAGVQDVQVKIHARAAAPGEHRRMHLLSLLDTLEDRVVGAGLLTTTALRRHRAALAAHLQAPETLLIDKLFVQAWGRV